MANITTERSSLLGKRNSLLLGSKAGLPQWMKQSQGFDSWAPKRKFKRDVYYDVDDNLSIIFRWYGSVWPQVLPWCILTVVFTYIVIYLKKNEIGKLIHLWFLLQITVFSCLQVHIMYYRSSKSFSVSLTPRSLLPSISIRGIINHQSTSPSAVTRAILSCRFLFLSWLSREQQSLTAASWRPAIAWQTFFAFREKSPNTRAYSHLPTRVKLPKSGDEMWHIEPL